MAFFIGSMIWPENKTFELFIEFSPSPYQIKEEETLLWLFFIGKEILPFFHSKDFSLFFLEKSNPLYLLGFHFWISKNSLSNKQNSLFLFFKNIRREIRKSFLLYFSLISFLYLKREKTLLFLRFLLKNQSYQKGRKASR